MTSEQFPAMTTTSKPMAIFQCPFLNGIRKTAVPVRQEFEEHQEHKKRKKLYATI